MKLKLQNGKVVEISEDYRKEYRHVRKGDVYCAGGKAWESAGSNGPYDVIGQIFAKEFIPYLGYDRIIAKTIGSDYIVGEGDDQRIIKVSGLVEVL